MTRAGSRFRRAEPRRRARAFALGLLAELAQIGAGSSPLAAAASRALLRSRAWQQLQAAAA